MQHTSYEGMISVQQYGIDNMRATILILMMGVMGLTVAACGPSNKDASQIVKRLKQNNPTPGGR